MRLLATFGFVLWAQAALGATVGPIPYSNLGQPDGPAKLDEAGKLPIGSDANAIYNAIYPGVKFSDWVSATFVNTQSSLTQQTGIAAYFRNQAAAFDGSINAVGLFAAGTAEVNSSASWGINTLLQDAATRAVGVGTGRILTNEFDFNVMNTDTEVYGLNVTGNSLAQPRRARGFVVSSIGVGIKWTTGFDSVDGATDYGLGLGTTEKTGIDVPSQLIVMGFRDHTGTRQSATLQVVSAARGADSFLQLVSSAGKIDVALPSQLFSRGLVTQDAGFGLKIGLSGPRCRMRPRNRSCSAIVIPRTRRKPVTFKR